MDNQGKLIEDVFGRDSESDLSEAGDLGDFGEDDLLPTTSAAAIREVAALPSFKKSLPLARGDEDDEEQDDDYEPVNRDRLPPRKPKKSKRMPSRQPRKRTRTDPSDEQQEEEAVKLAPALQEFEDTLNSLKNKRRVVEYNEMEADDIIEQIVRSMQDAAARDKESNMRREPATAKLKMLASVLGLLEKPYLHEQLLEHEMLTAIRLWLEPLPDGSLPSMSIRRPLIECLAKLPTTTELIRESRVGRVIMFYYRCERETPELKKVAAQLIGTWSRRVLGTGGNRTVNVNSRDTFDNEEKALEEDDMGKRNRAGDLGYVPKTARIPQSNRNTYTVAPASKVVETYSEKSGDDMFRRITQQLARSKNRK
eukprot:Partr_v1_DN25450_c1_g1_i2_m53438 putative IWS1 homolog (S. cerevisiae)